MNNGLMTFEEFREYMRVSTATARRMTWRRNCKYVVRVGRRVFIHKELLDREIERAAKSGISL